MKEIKINDYITVKIVKNKVHVFVLNEIFRQCKHVLINISIRKMKEYDTINSIDDVIENYGEGDINITLEDLLLGHSSNLIAWYEHGYDTRLIHSNLGFPLLKKLSEVGDPLAIKVFKEEIAKRLLSGNWSTLTFLVEGGYIDYLSREELESILDDLSINVIKDLTRYIDDLSENCLLNSLDIEL